MSAATRQLRSEIESNKAQTEEQVEKLQESLIILKERLLRISGAIEVLDILEKQAEDALEAAAIAEAAAAAAEAPEEAPAEVQ